MTLGLDLGKHARDLAVGADQEGGALDADAGFAVHVLFFEHTISLRELLVGVGQQRERQVILVFELLLPFRAVGRDAQDDGAGVLDFAVCVAEPARFNRSTGSVGLGEEVEDDVPAAVIFKGDALAVLVGQRKIRCSLIYIHG